MGVTVSLIFGPKRPADSLHKEATALKLAGDWDGAIAKLKLAKVHMLESSTIYGVETWTRLAKFLQYGGYFEESLCEFDSLLADIPRRIHMEYEPGDMQASYGEATRETIIRRAIRHQTVRIGREKQAVQRREGRRIAKLAKAASAKRKSVPSQ